MPEAAVRIEGFANDVLRAMAVDIATANAQPVQAVAARYGETDRFMVSYSVGNTEIGARRFRIEEETRTIADLTFALEKYERRRGFQNMLAIHERTLEHLSGHACVLTATIQSDHAGAWCPDYEWDLDHSVLNSTNLWVAVNRVYEGARNQSVWDATDLPQRVVALGGPSRQEAGSLEAWLGLTRRRSPSEILDGLNGIQPKLGEAVFKHMTCWRGRRDVT